MATDVANQAARSEEVVQSHRHRDAKSLLNELIPPRLTPGATLLVQISRVVLDPSLPTCTTAVKDGEVLLLLGKAYMEASPEEKALFLEHEACHVALAHSRRFDQHTGSRTREKGAPEVAKGHSPQAWNLAADAVIHHRCMDPTLLVEKVGAATFESLQLPPQPLEMAYDELMNRSKQNWEEFLKQLKEGGVQGCGREGHAIELPDWVAAEVAQAVSRDVLGRNAGKDRGRPLPLGPIQPDPPKWVKEVRAWMERVRGRGRERVRSWLRVGRDPLIAGRARVASRTGLILVDCSGSISDSMLNMVANLLSAGGMRPEVVLWAVDSTARLSREEAVHLLKTGGAPGGGTDMTEASQYRREGEPTIWITDGLVPSWPKMGPKELVLWTDNQPPAGVANIKIRVE